MEILLYNTAVHEKFRPVSAHIRAVQGNPFRYDKGYMIARNDLVTSPCKPGLAGVLGAVPPWARGVRAAEAPTPIYQYRFEVGSGTTTANTGSFGAIADGTLGGSAALTGAA
jgi:hypothetical protein